MLTPPFAAGASITAASLAAVASLSGFKFADQNSGQSTTTLQNDTDLNLALQANGTYIGWAQIIYSASVAASYDFGWTIPSGATLNWDPYPYPGSGAQNALTSANTPTASATGTANLLSFKVHWSVIMGAVAGNLQYKFAQHVSDATNCQTRQGSWLAGIQIA